MTHGTCQDCAFSDYRATPSHTLQYECRFNAPVGLTPAGSSMSPFPAVKPDMWCAEWKKGEKKEPVHLPEKPLINVVPS